MPITVLLRATSGSAAFQGVLSVIVLAGRRYCRR
jgi:hypothetical protein